MITTGVAVHINTTVQHGVNGVQPLPALVAAGADFLAVVSAVWDHPDGPAAAVIAFNRAMAESRA